jgi:hypothetical protein
MICYTALMHKKLILIFSFVFIISFLLFPSITYKEDGLCPSDIFANCKATRSPDFGAMFGGIKYIKFSVQQGSFSLSEQLVQPAPSNTLGSFSPDEDQYFSPSLAIAASILFAALVSAAYFLITRKKHRQVKN